MNIVGINIRLAEIAQTAETDPEKAAYLEFVLYRDILIHIADHRVTRGGGPSDKVVAQAALESRKIPIRRFDVDTAIALDRLRKENERAKALLARAHGLLEMTSARKLPDEIADFLWGEGAVVKP